MKKTFSRFKLLHLLLTLTLLLHLQIRSQNPMSCGSKINSSVTNLSSSQPTNCSYFLNDLVPNSTDSILEVRVKLHFFTPQSSPTSGVWGGMTKIDADTILAITNRKLANIQPPTLIIPGVPFISHPKIKLVYYGTGYYKIHDSVVYSYLDNAIPSYYDNNAINVFFGACDPGTQGLGCAIDVPGVSTFENVSYIRFRSDTSLFNLTYLGQTLAHESGHVLGLNHSTLFTYTNSPPYREPSAIAPTFGCCDSVGGSDYYHENLPNRAISNNLMSQNSGAYGHPYLSPHQMAIIHYNLRTRLLRLLTPKSYQDATVADHTSDYNVTTKETWTSDRYFKGNITVKANKTLTVKCGLAMTYGSRITVEPGALLVVDGGTITNISARLWDGIYLEGNPNQPQLTTHGSNTGAVVYQGMLRIKNNGTISNALIGVRNYLSNTSNSGGVIFAQDANFLNNVKDVEMIGPPTSSITSASWFYRCNFKTTGMAASNLVPAKHVSLTKVHGVRFRGCVFQYTANSISSHGDGIYSVDANYSVDKNGNAPCIFENLDRGIYVNNINPLKVPSIRNSKFIDNLFYAGYFMNSNYLIFENDSIQVAPYSNSEGFYLHDCKYYTIKNSHFTQNTYQTGPAISVYRSKTGSHQIYRNTFSNLFIAINCMDDNGNPNNPNDGLKMNCNKFNLTDKNLYDIALTHTTGLSLPIVQTNQGNISTAANANNLARNIYGATCTNNQNKWYIHSGSTVTINHGANTNSLTAVTQPTATGCKSSYLNVVNKNISLDFTTHCSPTPLSSGGTNTLNTNKIASMNDYLNSLSPSGDTYFEREATVASKLNIFLTDSLDMNTDSVITILQNNQGQMEDAHIQVIYAHLYKGDLAGALTKTDALPSGDADWKDFFTTLITLEGDTVNGIYDLKNNTTARNLFWGYATTNNKKGQAASQALLKETCDSSYTEPHAIPESDGARMAVLQNEEMLNEHKVSSVEVFPNPTETGITIAYNTQNGLPLKIELKDLVGKVIYTNFIYNSKGDQYISLETLNRGMYILTLTQDKKIIHKEKLIKH